MSPRTVLALFCRFVLLLLVPACSREHGRREVGSNGGPQNTSAGSSSLHPKSTLALGEPITARLVPLTEIAKTPERFENTVIATTGKVTAVCQEMGCWMEIQDEAGQAHVKMHGHTFFVPKTATGHVAHVQAKVLSDIKEACDDSPPPARALAHVELDATGVELD